MVVQVNHAAILKCAQDRERGEAFLFDRGVRWYIRRALRAPGVWATVICCIRGRAKLRDGVHGFYVWLPDNDPEHDTNREVRRSDLDHAVNTLAYLAGGGEL